MQPPWPPSGRISTYPSVQFCQATSDVAITATQMRRLVMIQSLAAFIFNIGVLAFSINVLGS